MIEDFVMEFAADEDLKELDITGKIIECMASRLKSEMIQELDNSLRNTFGPILAELSKNRAYHKHTCLSDRDLSGEP